jgi:membrane associated rhomboid family serine protease
MEKAFFEAPAPDGSRSPGPGGRTYPPAREPAINAPWPVAAISLGLVALYLLQSRFPLALVADALAFSPDRLDREPLRLITSLFVHGSWAHVLMNAAFILAFGAPVARLLGPQARGVASFFAFYLACGIVSGLGFALLHWGQPANIVGASGAASGLMGAAARLIGGHGRVGPMFSRAVTSMGFAWIIVNVIMAFAGGALIPGAGDAQIGWEAHLAGFAAGVLLIGAFARLAGRR